MQVILLKSVPKVGKRFDVVSVSSGYAMNLLIPKGLAVAATKENIKKTEDFKKEKSTRIEVETTLLKKNISALKDTALVITAKANEEGHLFAAIHPRDVVEAAAEQLNVPIPEEIVVFKNPIKTIGEHLILLESGDVKSNITINVRGE